MNDERTTDGVRWYQVPVVWVGILALIGSIIGCVATVAVSLQHSGDALAEVAPGGKFQLEPLDRHEPDRQDRIESSQ